MYGVDLIVTVEKCVYDLKEGDAKSVCSSETVMEKCRKGGELSKFFLCWRWALFSSNLPFIRKPRRP